MDLTKGSLKLVVPYNGPYVHLAFFLGSTPDSEVHRAPMFLELSGDLTVSWVLRNYFIFKLCVSVCLSVGEVYARKCRCSQRPGEGVGCPGARVPCGCELSVMDAGD